MSDVVVVQSSGSGQTGTESGARLVSEVARVVGGENETLVRNQALDCLNRVRGSLNKRDWRFMKTTHTAITLVNGTKTYSLPSAFKSPAYARLLDTSSRPDGDLLYADDAWFSHWLPDQETTGKPQRYLLRNNFGDGLITVFPTPDSSAATDYTLSVEYHARMSVISDNSSVIALPEEISEVLIKGAQYELMNDRGVDINRTLNRKADYYAALQELSNYDRRIGDEHARFRLGTARAPAGTVYIRTD